MKDIDTALRRLAEEVAPPSLMQVDAAVLAEIENYSVGARYASTPLRGLAVAVALVMGIAAGLGPEPSSDARPALADINGVAKFAPSTLLIGAL